MSPPQRQDNAKAIVHLESAVMIVEQILICDWNFIISAEYPFLLPLRRVMVVFQWWSQVQGGRGVKKSSGILSPFHNHMNEPVQHHYESIDMKPGTLSHAPLFQFSI